MEHKVEFISLTTWGANLKYRGFEISIQRSGHIDWIVEDYDGVIDSVTRNMHGSIKGDLKDVIKEIDDWVDFFYADYFKDLNDES